MTQPAKHFLVLVVPADSVEVNRPAYPELPFIKSVDQTPSSRHGIDEVKTVDQTIGVPFAAISTPETETDHAQISISNWAIDPDTVKTIVADIRKLADLIERENCRQEPIVDPGLSWAG